LHSTKKINYLCTEITLNMQFILKYMIIALLVLVLWAFGLNSSSNEPNISMKSTGLYLNYNNDSIFAFSENVNTDSIKNTSRRNSRDIESKVWMFNQNIILGY
jgi:hypothetical protein